MKRTSLPLQWRKFITLLGAAMAWPLVAQASAGGARGGWCEWCKFHATRYMELAVDMANLLVDTQPMSPQFRPYRLS